MITMQIPDVGNSSGSSRTELDRWLPRAVLCMLAVTLLVLLWLPIRRATADVEVNYNEGWNSYKQAMVANGTPLYGLPPGTFTGATSYPPLSFHLVSWLGRTGSFNVAGRWISLISLITTGILVGLTVRCAGASREVGLFSLLLYLTGITILMPSRLGMNDPQLLGEALSAAGLYVYVKAPGSKRMLWLSALAFCLAGFTKQTLIAFPVAVALDLIIRSRKLFAVWAGGMVAFAASLAILSMLVDGRYLFTHLTLARAYSLRYAWHHNVHPYLMMAQAPLLVGFVWMICASRPRPLFVNAFLLSHLVGFLLAGGDGVDANICFNAFAAAVIVCGIALAEVEAATVRLHISLPRLGLCGALMFAVLLSFLIHVPGRFREGYEGVRVLRSQEKEFQAAVHFLRSRPGLALCESLLLCYEAGKPFEFDPYSVSDGLKTRHLDVGELLELLQSHHFLTVQIKISPDEANLPTEKILEERTRSDSSVLPFEENLFRGRSMKAVLQDYRVVHQDSQMLIFALR